MKPPLNSIKYFPLKDAVNSECFKQEFPQIMFDEFGLSGKFKYAPEKINQFIHFNALPFIKSIFHPLSSTSFQFELVTQQNAEVIRPETYHLPHIEDYFDTAGYQLREIDIVDNGPVPKKELSTRTHTIATSKDIDKIYEERLNILLTCTGEDSIIQGYAAFSMILYRAEEILIYIIKLNQILVHPKFKKTNAWAALSYAVSRLAASILQAIYMNRSVTTAICPVLHSPLGNAFKNIKTGILAELNMSIDCLTNDCTNQDVRICHVRHLDKNK